MPTASQTPRIPPPACRGKQGTLAGKLNPPFPFCSRRAYRGPEMGGMTPRTKGCPMRTITTTEDLAAYCALAKSQPFVTIDTEFLRERTYWSKLCLIQMALPGAGEAVLIDPIEGEDLSLEPLYDLFRHEATVKVFHAARQDLEIFFVEGGVFPKPLFDTQVAAMVCGFGEQVGYETLVKRMPRRTSTRPRASPTGRAGPCPRRRRITRWADVTHRRVIYEFLAAQLKKNGRAEWVAEEAFAADRPRDLHREPR